MVYFSHTCLMFLTGFLHEHVPCLCLLSCATVVFPVCVRISQSLLSVILRGLFSSAVQFLLQIPVSSGLVCGNSLKPGLIVPVFKDLHLLLLASVDNSSWDELEGFCLFVLLFVCFSDHPGSVNLTCEMESWLRALYPHQWCLWHLLWSPGCRMWWINFYFTFYQGLNPFGSQFSRGWNL